MDCIKLDSFASFSCTTWFDAASSASRRPFSFKVTKILPFHSAVCSSNACLASSILCFILDSSASFSSTALLNAASSPSMRIFSFETAKILSSLSALCSSAACLASSIDCFRLDSSESFSSNAWVNAASSTSRRSFSFNVAKIVSSRSTERSTDARSTLSIVLLRLETSSSFRCSSRLASASLRFAFWCCVVRMSKSFAFAVSSSALSFSVNFKSSISLFAFWCCAANPSRSILPATSSSACFFTSNFDSSTSVIARQRSSRALSTSSACLACCFAPSSCMVAISAFMCSIMASEISILPVKASFSSRRSEHSSVRASMDSSCSRRRSSFLSSSFASFFALSVRTSLSTRALLAASAAMHFSFFSSSRLSLKLRSVEDNSSRCCCSFDRASCSSSSTAASSPCSSSISASRFSTLTLRAAFSASARFADSIAMPSSFLSSSRLSL
mmetsp:Transcript_9121/g.27363  ORF Transcript_9121/g.27363 Transcript_9121/m.27363 type:complete len:445 (-) Transcript_9121:3221-4555(-)